MIVWYPPPPPWTQHASFVILLNPETSSLILTLSQNSTPLIVRLLNMITWKIELHEQAVLKCCYSILSLIHFPYVAHCSLNLRTICYMYHFVLFCVTLWVLSTLLRLLPFVVHFSPYSWTIYYNVSLCIVLYYSLKSWAVSWRILLVLRPLYSSFILF